MTAARTRPRQRIEAAQNNLAAAQQRLGHDAAVLRAAFNRRRATWIVAGGLAGGFALGALPPRVWSRVGALLGTSAAIVARSVLAPMIAGALFARECDKPDPAEAAE